MTSQPSSAAALPQNDPEKKSVANLDQWISNLFPLQEKPFNKLEFDEVFAVLEASPQLFHDALSSDAIKERRELLHCKTHQQPRDSPRALNKFASMKT